MLDLPLPSFGSSSNREIDDQSSQLLPVPTPTVQPKRISDASFLFGPVTFLIGTLLFLEVGRDIHMGIDLQSAPSVVAVDNDCFFGSVV